MDFLFSALYFVIITPIALIARLCGYDPLRLSRTKERASALLDRNYSFTPSDFEHE